MGKALYRVAFHLNVVSLHVVVIAVHRRRWQGQRQLVLDRGGAWVWLGRWAGARALSLLSLCTTEQHVFVD